MTWIEIKVFLREPMGAVGTIVVPVLLFVALGRFAIFKPATPSSVLSGYSHINLAVLVSILISVSTVLSLVTIISIYREGGILKRLRATPLRPQTILSAHVIVKLILTAVTMALMFLAGKNYFPPGVHVPWFSFTIALLLSTWSILSIGFLIASMVPTARFAQPLGAIILYPMVAFSGLFFPLEILPPVFRAITRIIPFTYAVNLLNGIWNGDGWLPHLGDVAALVILFLIFTALSARVFRWE